MLVNWNGIPHLITISRKLHLKSSSLTPWLNVRDGQSCPPAGRPEDSLQPGSAHGPNAHSDQPPSCQLESLSGTSASWHFQIPEFLAAHLRELKDKHFLFFFFKSQVSENPENFLQLSYFFVCPLAPCRHLSVSGYRPENVLSCPPRAQLFGFQEPPVLLWPWLDFPLLPLPVTTSWPLPHTAHPLAMLRRLPSPDWPFLNFSKHELVTLILLCLDTFGDAHMADGVSYRKVHKPSSFQLSLSHRASLCSRWTSIPGSHF